MTPSSTGTSPSAWLYQHDGLLYGPVPASHLLEKVERGELGPDTPVAREGGAFRRLGEEPAFAVQVARIATRRRVEAEAREAEARRKRRKAIAIGVGGGSAIALALAAALGVGWAMRQGYFGPDEAELAALEIAATPPRFQLALPEGAEDEELVEYLDAARAENTGARAPARRSRAASPSGTPSAAAGVAVESRYDQAAIQAVLAREQPSLYPCLKAEARRDATFRGELPFTFTVGNDGRIARLWIDRAGYHKGPLYDCMRAAMARWRFPAFAGERPSVSLSFHVGG